MGRNTNVVLKLWVCAAVMLTVSAAQAASPSLGGVMPPGAQRGTEIELVLQGARLNDAKEILFYTPGFTVSEVTNIDANQAKAKVKIDASAKLGEHPLRLRTASGITELRTFYVGAYPVVQEKEPNSDFKEPQKVDFNVTVQGKIDNEDVDYFLVEAKKGQRITAEVEGMRLGRTLFDPYLAIMDLKRFELAAADDSPLHLQDPVVSLVAPEDGTYVIQLRETTYGGDGNCHYRLHVGTFPRPRTVYPLGGQAGQDLAVEFIGDVKGSMKQTVKLPAEATVRHDLVAEQDGLVAPSANPIRVSAFPNVLEVEPNNDQSKATPASGELPLAFNGIIQAPADIDFFKFTAKKGQAFDLHCYGRRLRSPLDPIMVVINAKGAGLTSNDDSGGPDAYVQWTAPEDGEYGIYVVDYLRRGGPEYTYRIEITTVKPSLAVSIPELANNSQERLMIAVPKGNRFGSVIRTARSNFGGEVLLTPTDLPPGVKVHATTMPAGVDTMPVVFEAAPDAPIGGKLCDFAARHADEKQNIKGDFTQTLDLIVGQNNTPMYQVTVNKLAIAVVDELPFKLTLAEPKVPLVQNGSMNLKVKVERKPEFKGAVAVRMLWNSPGVGASNDVSIPADKSEALIPVNAAGNAAAGKWPIAVLGSSDVSGPAWVCSQPGTLEVAAPFVAAKMAMVAVEKGQKATVTVDLEQKTKFEGKAKDRKSTRLNSSHSQISYAVFCLKKKKIQ